MKKIRYPKKEKKTKKRKGKIKNDSDNSELSANDKTEDINNNKKILYPKEYKNELTNEDFIHLKLDNKKQNIKNKEKTIKNEHKEKNGNYNPNTKKDESEDVENTNKKSLVEKISKYSINILNKNTKSNDKINNNINEINPDEWEAQLERAYNEYSDINISSESSDSKELNYIKEKNEIEQINYKSNINIFSNYKNLYD